MTDKLPTILSRLAAKPAIDYAAIRSEKEKRDALFARRVERLKRWAMSADKEKLADQYAHNVLKGIAERGLIRAQREAIARYGYSASFHSAMSDSYQQDAERFAEEMCRIHAERRNGAVKKKANDKDGKQAAKAGALALWLERDEGKQRKLVTVEQFAIEVMRRWPVLRSSKVICGWSAGWTKDVKAGRTPSC